MKLSTYPQPIKNQPAFLTVTQAAKYLKISPDTLRNWDNSGKLIASRTIGKSRRYRFSDLRQISKQLQSARVIKHPLIPISSAARFLGVSPETLRNWEKKGLITSQRTTGRARRFSRAQLTKIAGEINLTKKLPEPAVVATTQISKNSITLPFYGFRAFTTDGKFLPQTFNIGEFSNFPNNQISGNGKIDKFKKFIKIITPQITKNSKIFLTATSETFLILQVMEKKAGESFTVSLSQIAPSPVTFDWLIIN